MFYKYDKDNFIYVKDKLKITLFFTLLPILLTLSFFLGRYQRYQTLEEFEKEVIILNIKEEKERFTEEKLIEEIKRLNIKFPHIVLAQSKLETGHFTSEIFLHNNNLFGMKEAKLRVNTAEGTSRGHAYYSSWEESVFDYAFYQSRYLGQIKTEDEYFTYLSMSYAEASDYVRLLKELIERESLRELFE